MKLKIIPFMTALSLGVSAIAYTQTPSAPTESKTVQDHTKPSQQQSSISTSDLKEMNHIIIRSQEDIDQLIFNKIKGISTAPVHALITVSSEEELKKAKSAFENLIGIAESFEIQFTKDIIAPVTMEFFAPDDVQMKLILSGNAPNGVHFGYMILRLAATSIEIKDFHWRNMDTPNTMLEIRRTASLTIENVTFSNITYPKKMPYRGAPIIKIYGNEEVFPKSEYILKNVTFSDLSHYGLVWLDDTARKTYKKTTIENTRFENCRLKNHGIDISVADTVQITGCTINKVDDTAAFVQFEGNATVTIENSTLSGHVYEVHHDEAPSVNYKNNRISGEAYYQSPKSPRWLPIK